MKNNYFPVMMMMALLGLVAWMTLPSLNNSNLPNIRMAAMGSETAKARVTEIIEDDEIDLGGTLQRYQVARVELLEGLSRHRHGNGLWQTTDPFQYFVSRTG
jgi:hypothetical protein